MLLKTVVAAGAIFCAAAFPAHAGGFKYYSLGGNLGNWSYADAAAGGTINVGSGCGAKCGGSTVTGSTDSYAITENYLTPTAAGAYSQSGTVVSTTGGSGQITAVSSAVAGAGLGAGVGGKAGGGNIAK